MDIDIFKEEGPKHIALVTHPMQKKTRAIDSLDWMRDFLAATPQSLADAIEGQNGRRKEDLSGEGRAWASQNSAAGTPMCQDRLRHQGKD